MDTASGVVSGFSAFITGIGMGLLYLADSGMGECIAGHAHLVLIQRSAGFDALVASGKGLTASMGWALACAAVGAQFVGALAGCIGTCQEMHDIAMLARTLHIGAYKEKEATKLRSDKAAKIRDTEAGEAKTIYENFAKRKKAAEAALRRVADPGGMAEEDDEEKGADKPKSVIMLKRVLFRRPVEGDDDEIPTKMLEDAFAEIDGDGSGSIELDELVGALKQCGLAVSKGATDTIMKEIDKNASGDVDLREFIEFFRHIEELNRFQKKSAARQQFVSFLLNFCFLADMIVVGVMLMMFIRMDKAANPDNYSIMKNVLLACSIVLGILFLLVILMPILRLALGPTANRMQKQYELAQEIKKSQKKKVEEMENSNQDSVTAGGEKVVGYSPDDPPPPVNAAMFGRSYRPGKVDSNAWTPAIEDLPPLGGNRPSETATGHSSSAVVVSAAGRPGSSAASKEGSQGHDDDRAGTKHTVTSRQSVQVHGHGHNWRYDPSNYSIAAEHAAMLDQAGLGPTSWTPMQVADVNIPKQTGPALLPGAPLALTDAAFPQNNR